MNLHRSQMYITMMFVTIMMLFISVMALGEVKGQTLQAAITISGTVTDEGGNPVPGVFIRLESDQERHEVTTDSNGFYSVVIQADGVVWFDVLPNPSLRLSQIHLQVNDVTGNFTQDFELSDGFLLEITTSSQVDNFDVQPLFNALPNGQRFSMEWDQNLQKYRSVFPPDIYYVTTQGHHDETLQTTAVFDLQHSDVISNIVLNTHFVPAIPIIPPESSKISFGEANNLGEVLITGDQDSVLPWSHVLLVNLNSTHQTHVFSDENGRFSASLFAPPGSAIMVKHGPPGPRWQYVENGIPGGINPYPGTIIHRPHQHLGQLNERPFAATGAVAYQLGAEASEPSTVGAAWTLTGITAPSEPLSPGETLQISGMLQLISHAITNTTNVNDISVTGQVQLMMIYDEHGNPIGAENFTGSTRLTTTGFPIRHGERSIKYLNHDFTVDNLTYVADHTIAGDIHVSVPLSNDTPLGRYRPFLAFQFNGVPLAEEWVTHADEPENYRTFEHYEAALPPIEVTNNLKLEQPFTTNQRVIWRLLMNNPAQGIRGTGAREDVDRYGLATFVVTQDAPYIIPPLDTQTNEAIQYRIEPFLPMYSYTDRRMPAPPYIPFDLPGGALCVQIDQPDGSQRNLGCEPFAQSLNRQPTSRTGGELNDNSVQYDNVYSLTTNHDRFKVEFTQYGHHVIHMTGQVEDIWANGYEGGGTYDVWVAEPLDLDLGVLPGTPMAIGDTLNPMLQIHPAVAADVELTLTHVPHSDPTQKIVQTISGKANTQGTFAPAENFSPFTEAGEFRVDVTAVYTDPITSKLYMGAMTWGSIVMTPANQTPLIAHGRRGLDNPPLSEQWFLTCQLANNPGSGHIFNPYLNGDVIWSHMDDEACGMALILTGTLQDTVGEIVSRAQTRYERVWPMISIDPLDWQPLGQLPLFSSSYSGHVPQLTPDDLDQIAYAYLYSQRPGVRVREDVTEDGLQGSGYWRFDSRYDDQLGVGRDGDLPNDFKFQYAGIVYRDLEYDVEAYLGHGSGWVHLPDDDVLRTRVMPPFSGPGNGGWTTQGGPLMTLQGQDIHMFVLPTGVRPGSVLTQGELFRFAGHLMPTLASQIEVTITAPSGQQHLVNGQANSIGYFYNQADDFVLDEAGVWEMDVQVWHDGQIGSGEQVNCDPNDPFNPLSPCPAGDVLGSENGRFHFYVLPESAPDIVITTPKSGLHTFEGYPMPPIEINGRIPQGLNNVSVYYTITMPGFILDEGQATVENNTFTFDFDPTTLHEIFPNIDLQREDWEPGLVDTFTIRLFLQGNNGTMQMNQAGTITIQGNQIFVKEAAYIYLPTVLR